MSANGNVRRADNTRSNWETPPELFELLRVKYNFNLDLAASETNHLADNWKSGEDNCSGYCIPTCGLHSEISHTRIFCNPPYGDNIGTWIRRFAQLGRDWKQVVALVPANTDTRWFAQMADSASEIHLLTGRVQFLVNGERIRDANGKLTGNTGGSLVAIWHPGPRKNGCRFGVWDWKQ